jgi:ribosomal protein L22
MKGEIPHRKGKGIMSGRYPRNAAEHFIKLLKTLKGNSNVNGIEEPIIVEAFANLGERPFGKFGAVRRKRTHIRIVAKNKAKKQEKKK